MAYLVEAHRVESEAEVQQTDRRPVQNTESYQRLEFHRLMLEEVEVAGAVEEDEGDKQMPETGKGRFGLFPKWKDFTRPVRN